LVHEDHVDPLSHRAPIRRQRKDIRRLLPTNLSHLKPVILQTARPRIRNNFLFIRFPKRVRLKTLVRLTRTPYTVRPTNHSTRRARINQEIHRLLMPAYVQVHGKVRLTCLQLGEGNRYMVDLAEVGSLNLF